LGSNTIYEWQHLLKPDKYKEIIIESLRYLVEEKRIWVYGFVILSNHMHLIWQMREGNKREDVQRDFLKYTAQTIRFDLQKNHPKVLPYFEVNLKDRKYQFWKRNPISIDLFSHSVFMQKLEYIHWNPVKAGLCELPEDYEYSSASFYEKGITRFGFLSHYAA